MSIFSTSGGHLRESNEKEIRSFIYKPRKLNVTEDSLSIINITRIELTENRHAINNLSLIVRELDKKFTNITHKLKMDALILDGVVQT